jgi:tRNA dimethylallyltransferase
VSATPRPIVLILGPTAGGKTELAIELARRLPGGGECVCADSMQVYRGMDIGTAKPTAAQRAAVPHHLLDIASPAADDFSVDRWLDLARAAIGGVRARGRWPLVAGGTNLYVQALLYGLCAAPPPEPALRRELAALDAPALRRRLERADPAAAERIHPNDRKRSIRAIEVYERGGAPLSGLQSQWRPGGARTDALLVVLEHPIEAINRRINARVRHMFAAGLVDEVASLVARGELGPLARAALGYRQVIDHLEGRCGLDEACEQVKIRTRRYAKQQRTWLRRFAAEERSIRLAAADATPQELADKAHTAILAALAAGLAGAVPAALSEKNRNGQG